MWGVRKMNIQAKICSNLGNPNNKFLSTTRVGRLSYLLIALAAWTALSIPSGAMAQLVSNCLPSCDETDGRFLSIPGANLSTLTAQDINIRIAVPSDVGQFQVQIFDGDTNLTGGPDSHWDLNNAPGQDLHFEMFYADGSDDPVSNPAWPLTGIGNTMPDNAWFSAPTINTEARAQDADGLYRYRLRVRLANPASSSISNFKLRITPDSVLATIGEPFGFQAPIYSFADAEIIFPDWPSNVGDPNHIYPDGFGNKLTPAEPDYSPNTTYDGTFTFFARNGLPGEGGVDPTEFVAWDGDLDRGSFNNTMLDTDDPNTPNDLLPVWAVTDTKFEAAQPVKSDNPPDDFAIPEDLNTFRRALVRTPAVAYDVFPADDTGWPGGTSFVNDNPSGNQEWEQFRLSEADEDPSTADYWGIADLKPGIYKIVLRGMDLQNFNAWRVPAICVDSNGNPCPEPQSVRIGDRVWQDVDGDALGGGSGATDDDEPGIPGVLMNVYSQGNLINQTVTDVDGRYQFRVTAGNQGAAAPYTVQVAPENFSDLGPRGSIGCDVYLDANGNGTRDPDETGLGNIRIVLRDAGLSALGVALTDANGLFRFNNLPPGDYIVDLVDGTVPVGLTLSGGTDPSEILTITSTEALDVSVGYQNTAGAVIGNLIWTDVNQNGMREPDEPGFNGVTVALIDLGDDGAIGGINGNTDTLAATADTIGGRYLFTNVADGAYIVEVTDLRARLTDYDWVFGPNGTALPTDRSEPFAVVAGNALLDKDFGYLRDNLPMITDSVWLDTDRDGLRDADELGLANVTVSLNESQGIFGDDISVAVATTDANGVFSFAGVPDGDYRMVLTGVNSVLAGLLPTTPAGLTSHAVMVVGPNITGNHFGFNVQGQLATAFNTTPGGAPPQEITDSVQDQDVLTYDFGYQFNPVVIGDDVFADLDQSGLPPDPGEPGVPGVCLTLRDGDGNLIRRTVTDGNGKYAFPVLPGEYTIEVCPESLSTAPLGIIGDRVWLDVNGNGADDGEPGIPNVSVMLFDATTDTALAATGTDGNGFYSFNNLMPGSYYTSVVGSTVPAGVSLSGGSDPSATVTIPAAGGAFLDLDFGYGTAGKAAIGDFVWFDSDGSMTQGAGEAGISGVVVNLINSGGSVIATAPTVGGYYLFAGLEPGTYTVAVAEDNFDPGGALEGYVMSGGIDPAVVALGAGEINLDVDFGYRTIPLFSIVDRVWRDDNRNMSQDGAEAGVPDVAVVLIGPGGDVIAQTTTDTNGDFSFLGLPDGEYRLVVTDVTGELTDLLPTTAAAVSGQPVSLASADVSGINFGYAATGQLAGQDNTTGGNSITRSVSSDDDTFDFGYFVPQQACGKCAGKVTKLTLEYLGHVNNARIMVKQRKDGAVVFNGVVQPGQSFSFMGTYNGTLGTEISVYVNWRLNTKIHTSCSQPIGPGLVFGDFEVIAGESLKGGPLCPEECVEDDDSSSEDSKSGDSKSGDSKSGYSKSGDSKSSDSKSGDSKSGDSKSDDDSSGNSKRCGCPNRGDDGSSDGDDSSGDGASRDTGYHKADDASSDDDDSSDDGASSVFDPHAVCGPGEDDASSDDDDSSGDGASNDRRRRWHRWSR